MPSTIATHPDPRPSRAPGPTGLRGALAPSALRTTLELAGRDLRTWSRRRWLAALGLAVAFAVLIGVPTVLIPNPVFGREIPVVAWNYPVWLVSSALAGMLAATYLRGRGTRSPDASGAGSTASEATDSPSRLGMAGGVLAWFAVGCPVCNKIALLALGYSGAITWFAPFQPVLAVAALVLTAVALVVRLRGQVACAVPPSGAGRG